MANNATASIVELPSPEDWPTATAAKVIKVAGLTAVRATKFA
jgi:hypothetical protein